MKNTKLSRWAAVGILLAGVAFYASLRLQTPTPLAYDRAYWPSSTLVSDPWTWAITPAGINYSLYLPTGAKESKEEGIVPLIVVFHGNGEKALVKDRFGRLFAKQAVQERFGERGLAVLAVQSRVEYFSDPDAYTRLIMNVAIEHPVIDARRVALYGFSQGAAFVQELAMAHPSFYRAVVSGSSYYSASPKELFKAARVRFWCATSKNDKGIYEQGHATGQILALMCPDSRYVEYESRGHFYVEPQDRSGKGEETMLDWLVSALEP